MWRIWRVQNGETCRLVGILRVFAHTSQELHTTLTHTDNLFSLVAHSFCCVICQRICDVFIDRVFVLHKSRLMR